MINVIAITIMAIICLGINIRCVLKNVDHEFELKDMLYDEKTSFEDMVRALNKKALYLSLTTFFSTCTIAVITATIVEIYKYFS